MIKLVKEHINEKFSGESDPIKDLGIGLKNKIEKWINYYNTLRPDFLYVRNYNINDDLTIDASWVDLSFNELHKFPTYIKFNKINIDFSCEITNFENFKLCGPKIVYNNLLFYDSRHANFNKKDIEEVCKVGGKIYGLL